MTDVPTLRATYLKAPLLKTAAKKFEKGEDSHIKGRAMHPNAAGLGTHATTAWCEGVSDGAEAEAVADQ